MTDYRSFFIPAPLLRRIEEQTAGTDDTVENFVLSRTQAYARKAADAAKCLPRLGIISGNDGMFLPKETAAQLEALHPGMDLTRICARVLYLHFGEADWKQGTATQAFRLPAALRARLETEAIHAGCSVPTILRHAIANYLYGHGAIGAPISMIRVPPEIADAMPPPPPGQTFTTFAGAFPDALLDYDTQCDMPPAFISRAQDLLAAAPADGTQCRTLDQLFTVAVCVYLNTLGPLPDAPRRIEDIVNAGSVHAKLHAAARRAPRLGR
jgi:hypothetical protein